MARIITTRALKPYEHMEFPIFQIGGEVLMVDPQHPDYENYKIKAQLVKRSLEDRLINLKKEVVRKWDGLSHLVPVI